MKENGYDVGLTKNRPTNMDLSVQYEIAANKDTK